MNNPKTLSASYDTRPFLDFDFKLSFVPYQLSKIANKKIDEHISKFYRAYTDPFITTSYLFTLDADDKGKIHYHLVKLTDSESAEKIKYLLFITYRLSFYSKQTILRLDFVSSWTGLQLSGINIHGFGQEEIKLNIRKCVDFLISHKSDIQDRDLEFLLFDPSRLNSDILPQANHRDFS